MQASGDTSLLNDIEKQEEQTVKQISRITGTGMRREGLFGGGSRSRQAVYVRSEQVQVIMPEMD